MRHSGQFACTEGASAVNLPGAPRQPAGACGAEMLKPDEVKFLALLVQKEKLEKSVAEKLFADLSLGKSNRTLDQALLDLQLFSPERLQFFHATGCEDVPGVPGYSYVAKAGVGGTSVVMKAIDT